MFTKKVVIECTDDDINSLVRGKVAPLTDNPERYKDFECAAEFEWNSACYDVSVSKSDIDGEIYQKYDRKNIISGRSFLSIHDIMVFLLEHDIIEEGNYLIDASW